MDWKIFCFLCDSILITLKFDAKFNVIVANVNYTGQTHWKTASKFRILMAVSENKLSNIRHIRLA